ncbi:MAG: RNA polymerase sigma factor [Clostridia bacterium]|nr:RNA polymerase sigma factor [Clostridia bacterium]
MGVDVLDALLGRIANGDNAAFEEFYGQTSRGVYAFVYTYFRNRADTEDVLQTVYLKVKTGIHSYRVGTNPRAWLLQIAKNQALTEFKKRRREVPTEVIEIVADPCFGEGTVMDAMRRCLSEDEQRIVTLHVLWAYKHKEIAEILGCPTGTVTSKYKRAIDKLKKYLKEDE